MTNNRRITLKLMQPKQMNPSFKIVKWTSLNCASLIKDKFLKFVASVKVAL